MPVTTTVYVDEPTASAEPSQPKKAPVSAIAGGIAAGACLALAIVVAWIIWRRRNKRSKVQEDREAVSDCRH
jgi:ABC-type Fe3+ transport system permease subunit